MTIYQATVCSEDSPKLIESDHRDVEAAIKVVEAAGSGRIVQFNESPNMPGCLPAIVLRSCAMWTYADNVWHSHYIFDGYGGKMAEERPS